MALFGVWSRFGFKSNPYSEKTLLPDEEGHVLLSGRDREIHDLQDRIGGHGTHPSVEGPTGAGKTSLINVATYRMRRHCLDRKEKELWLPATERFQPGESAKDFEDRVYRVLMQTLIQYRDDFEDVGLIRPNMDQIEDWLNSPEYGGWQFSGGAASLQGGYGRSSEPNTAIGFEQAGFPRAARAALRQAFPAGTGGIVCVLDNLEILESTGAARRTLDQLRDRVFNIPEVRWVLCGSRGLVSRARSDRLSGIFEAPLIIPKLQDGDAVGAVSRRIEHFGTLESEAPVTPKMFEMLYVALNRNMRDALAWAQTYSNTLARDYPHGRHLPSSESREEAFVDWLSSVAENAYQDAQNVQRRHWKFFSDACERMGGRVGSSEYESFDFRSQQQMTSAVTALVNANLMNREVDPDDGTRTINSVTATGWLVNFHLKRELLDEIAEDAGQ